MRKVSSIKRKLLNYFKKNMTYEPLILNETSVSKESTSYIPIKVHIYIPRCMERIHHIVSLNPFIINIKEITLPDNKKLAIINCGILIIYIDDYFMKKTYFFNFNAYVDNEITSKILNITQNKISNFNLITSRYIVANLDINLNG